MSDPVQRRMEYMAEELNDMCCTKLYKLDEVRIIRRKRKAFEDKIHSVTKTSQDFKDYIQYEKCLLKDLRLRRDKRKIYGKQGNLEHKVMKRIKELFETALQRFSNDFSLYLSYFKFCKQVNYTNAASTAIESMLKHHMDKPEVWQTAANWYAHDQKDIKYALKIILKGCTIHSNSKVLYTQAIEFEIFAVKEAEKAVTTVTENNENSIADIDSKHKVCCAKLKTYIDSIFTNIKDLDYYIEILRSLEPFKFTEPVQTYLIEEILKEHSGKCIIWHTLAQRELKGYHYNVDVKSNQSFVSLCFAKYEEGLEKVDESERVDLWSNYLNCLIEMKHRNKTTNTDVNDVLEKAYKMDCLPEKYFVTWLEIVEDDEAMRVLEKGTKSYPQSVDLWKLRLRYQIIKDAPDEVNKVFKAGVTELKEKALPLWTAVLRYHLLTSNNDLIESIYRDGIKAPEEVSVQLKPRYLEWLSLEKGMKQARLAYNELVDKKPYCKELHLVMLKLEATEIEYNFAEWEKVHQKACQQFGREDVDVWINYIQFYAHFNKSELTNEKIQTIYKQAENLLPPLLKSYFIDKYNNTLATL